MALVSTMPAKGQTAKVYDIPDAELAKFKTLEATKSTYEEGKDKIASGKEIAGGVDLDKTDVKSIPQKPLRAYLAPLSAGPLEFLSIILDFALPRSQPTVRKEKMIYGSSEHYARQRATS